MRTPVAPGTAAETAAGSVTVRGRGEVVGDKFRFTVLADGLVRYEWAPDGVFEDRPSAFALHRARAGTDDFSVETTDDGWLEITTARLKLTYNQAEFSAHGLFALVFGHTRSLWRYGYHKPWENLGGTARTLDGVDGRVDWGTGIMSQKGYATIDDSDTMLFAGDGFVCPRRPGAGRVDAYLFAYGHDYRDAIRAFYTVSGFPPVLPRWALGNWWSRYYPYSARSYLQLMNDFDRHKVPLAVAVLDMDWHLAEDDPRVIEAGHTGWTGYTWNRSLFPDPPAFLAELHRRGLRTTLNEHPADGVHSYEDLYDQFCRAVGRDPSSKRPVPFDITDPRYLRAYFDVLLRSLERDGCDFWWIDWQQGEYTKLRGVDPLWMLNHFHFEHIKSVSSPRDRPLVLSRYAGPGSHRYPAGFSGDAVVSWASLRFQPAFTATAANVGYGWWSHDIGGHFGGTKDAELTTRWVQLGAFSPLLRLHSTRTRWVAKEPWRLPAGGPRETVTHFLRLRHRMLPYLHSMNVRASREGLPLVQPLYWEHPRRDEAYKFEYEYLFGSELLVLPVTDPADRKLGLARTKGWLPPGTYVDFFTGNVYSGDRELWVSRPLERLPVFAKQGAIVPLDGQEEPPNGAGNPEWLELIVVVGADGSFDLVEEDAGTETPDWDTTYIRFDQAKGRVDIRQPSGSGSRTRWWTLTFLGYQAADKEAISVLMDGRQYHDFQLDHDDLGLKIYIPDAKDDVRLVVNLGDETPGGPRLKPKDPLPLIESILDTAEIEYALKEAVWSALTPPGSDSSPPPTRLQQLRSLDAIAMGDELRLAVTELLTVDEGASQESRERCL